MGFLSLAGWVEEEEESLWVCLCASVWEVGESTRVCMGVRILEPVAMIVSGCVRTCVCIGGRRGWLPLPV